MTKTLKEYNYGFALLKIWMCFEVVLCHFDDGFNYGAQGGTLSQSIGFPFKEARFLAVPCFVIMSFYLTTVELISCGKDLKKLKKRLSRLLVPHIFWAFCYFFYYLIDAIINRGSTVEIVKQLILQLAFGHTLNATMWFQFALIVLTVVYVLLFHLFGNEKINYIAVSTLVVAFVFQYTGINYTLFSWLPSYMSYPLGRLCEVVPYASIGVLTKNNNWLVKFKTKTISLLLCGICCVLSMIANEKILVFQGFGYQGVFLFVAACLLVYLFNAIPGNKIPFKVQRWIVCIAPYTMGTYCSHRLVGKLFRTVLPNTPISKGFVNCVLVFILSIGVSMVISHIPNDWCKKSVT